MRFMNEYDIEDAVLRYRDYPVLGPASQTLENLMHATNAMSDGWCYWPKPARAAAKLMELIEGDPQDRYSNRDDTTPKAYAAALTPIKALRTRHNMTFEIVNPT